MTYTELQSACGVYSHRTDLDWPVFIARAEMGLFRELRLKETTTKATGTTSGALIILPADFGEMERLTVSYYGAEIALDYGIAPDEYGGNIPQTYSIEGANLRLHCAPGTAYAYTIYYTPKLVPLSDANPTNWLSENAGDLYMYAACREAAAHARDAEQVVMLAQIVAALITSVRELQHRRGQSAAGGLQIKVRRQWR